MNQTNNNHAASFQIEKRGQKYKVKGLGNQTGRQFTLSCARQRWRVTGLNSTGSRVRQLLQAADLCEAVEEAVLFLYKEEEDAVASLPKEIDHLSIPKALTITIESRGGSREHQSHQAQSAGYFCDWATKQKLTLWADLRYHHIVGYMNSLIERKLKPKTISHYLAPVRSTSRYMAQSWPETYRDFAAGLRLPRHRLIDSRFREDRGRAALTFAQVLDFAKFLESYPDEEAQKVLPGVLLQGVCGLQLLEALRLKWSDVDLLAETITIQGEVKNEYRIRRIPIPKIVLGAIERNPQLGKKVVHYLSGSDPYSKRVKRLMLKWDKKAALAPKDLRNTLQTHALRYAVEEGWNTTLVDRYVGHAPKSMAERHYFEDRPSELLAMFREHLMPRIESALSAAQNGKKMARTEVPQKQKGLQVVENQRLAGQDVMSG